MGTKRYKSRFLTFEQARTLGLTSRKEWVQLCHSQKRPIDMPVLPHLTYKRDGWISWADFLGCKYSGRFMPFNEARKFVRSLGFKTVKEWARYSSSGKRPRDIPSDPARSYKKEYLGGIDWIGFSEERFLPFIKARKYVRENMTVDKWWEWSKTHRPSNIPSRPDIVYKDKGWKGWVDWFGGSRKRFLPYRKAKALARTLGIQRKKEWDLLRKQKKRPREIPACPHAYYEEFEGYPHFFGYVVRIKAKKNRR